MWHVVYFPILRSNIIQIDVGYEIFFVTSRWYEEEKWEAKENEHVIGNDLEINSKGNKKNSELLRNIVLFVGICVLFC